MYLALVGWHQPAAISILQLLPPSQWDRGENRKIKIWILVAWDSLISKVWGMGNTQEKNKTNDAKVITHHFSQVGWWPASVWATVTFPKKPSPHIYCWAWHDMMWNVPLVTWGQLSRLCPFPASCPPQPTCCGGKARRKGKPGWCASTAQQ